MKTTSTKPTNDSTRPRQVVVYHRSKSDLLCGNTRVTERPVWY